MAGDAGHSADCRHQDDVGRLQQDDLGRLHRDRRRSAAYNHLDAVHRDGHHRRDGLRPDEQTPGVAESVCHWATTDGPEEEVQPCRWAKEVAREQ